MNAIARVAAVAALCCALLTGQSPPVGSVGLPFTIADLILPGSELEPAPMQDAAPLLLRVTRSFVHGTGHRYELVVTGFVVGDHDLRPYLRRKDGSGTGDLPPLPIKVAGILPAERTQPNDPARGALPTLGGYERSLWWFGGAWLAGLIVILVWSRRRRAQAAAAAEHRVTLAERMRPLVEAVLAGERGTERLAELERMLLTWWQRQLRLEGVPAKDAIVRMKADPEAGRLLRALELWLHSQNPPPVDVGALLAPYQDVAPDPQPQARAQPQPEPTA